MENLSKCVISGLPITNFKTCTEKNHGHKPFFHYNVKIDEKDYQFAFCLSCYEETEKYINENKYILLCHLLNGKELPQETREKDYFDKHPYLLHKKDFENFIKQQSFPVLPTEKLNNLFLKLSSYSLFAGQVIHLDINNHHLPLKYYLANFDELIFYIRTLEADGLIKVYVSNSTPSAFYLTYKGLLKSIEIQEEGFNSNRCFIAMSFDKSDEYIYQEAIEPICKQFNFQPIRVDKIHPEIEQTINDLIIAELKKSKFIIADFTRQKNGVYFEAGYGLGRGKKVIYTCDKKDFDKLHFDVNHFPILIYESTSELKEMLKSKIEAYILD